jgi:hypothetical protein
MATPTGAIQGRKDRRMNSQQAINLLNGLEQKLDDYCELHNEGKAAFRMAITALELFGNAEQLESGHEKDHVADPGKMVGDLISRQAAIDARCNR